jgi:hypothetical protein
MKKSILLLLILNIYSCSKIEDETNNICLSNCTILQGKFITTNNIGIEGIKVSLSYKSFGTLGTFNYTRLIAETQTDENGKFYQEFYVKENELGNLANGCFIVDFDDANLDSNEYILSGYRIETTTPPLEAFYSINSRDTIIGNTYYLPKKTDIKVILNNFNPLKEGDYFEVATFYPFGPSITTNNFLNSEYATGFSGGSGMFKADGINSKLNPFVADNEENIIQITRRKNGVFTKENISVFVPINNTLELNYEY